MPLIVGHHMGCRGRGLGGTTSLPHLCISIVVVSSSDRILIAFTIEFTTWILGTTKWQFLNVSYLLTSIYGMYMPNIVLGAGDREESLRAQTLKRVSTMGCY